MATYTKLKSGNWGIRSTSELIPGQVVAVTTKAGATKMERVEHVVWSGNGVWLAAIAQSAPQRSSANRSHRRAPYGKIECDECGDYVTRGSVCWETGCRH